MPSIRSALSLALALTAAAFSLGACAQGGHITEGGGGNLGGVGGGDEGDLGACLIDACHKDIDCAGCAAGRLICHVASRRCVACDPDAQTGCAEGEICSQFGACVPAGQTCHTGADGAPDFSCAGDEDCAACDPLHQVCDPATPACVACTVASAGACAASEICRQDACVPRCPNDCVSDSDCSACGAQGHEAHACNAGQCAACSATSPCPEGMSCSALGQCKPSGGSSSSSSGSGSSSSGGSGSGSGTSGAGGADPGGSGGADPGVGGGDPGAGGGDPGGACHDICAAGDPLDMGCDPCVSILCAQDDYCCSTAWDSLCVSEVDMVCNNACSGGGGGCAHPECQQGDALDAACSDCAGAVCAADDYCCSTAWDSLCVNEVGLYCASGC
ncbi:MAG: hypothetical protein U0359_32695 [Byssovorax sp.]